MRWYLGWSSNQVRRNLSTSEETCITKKAITYKNKYLILAGASSFCLFCMHCSTFFTISKEKTLNYFIFCCHIFQLNYFFPLFLKHVYIQTLFHPSTNKTPVCWRSDSYQVFLAKTNKIHAFRLQLKHYHFCYCQLIKINIKSYFQRMIVNIPAVPWRGKRTV